MQPALVTMPVNAMGGIVDSEQQKHKSECLRNVGNKLITVHAI